MFPQRGSRTKQRLASGTALGAAVGSARARCPAGLGTGSGGTPGRESEAGGEAEGRRRTEAWPAGRREVAPAQGAGAPSWRRLSQWAAALAPPGGGGGAGRGWEARGARLRRLGVRRGRVRAVLPPPPQAPPRDEGAGRPTERRVTPKVLWRPA